MSLLEVCQWVAERLRAAGITAEHDARDLNLPGAWVTPGDVTFNRLADEAAQVEIVVALVAPDVGGVEALRILDDMLAKTRDAGIGAATFEPGTVQLENHAPGSLPALITTITLDTTP